MKISILIPCHNEEKWIGECLETCLRQARMPDEIIVVDDSSTDRTPKILERYQDRVKVVRTPKNLGNKSYAQEFGLQFVSGDIFIATDGDTLLDRYFVERVEKNFQTEDIAAVAGYVKSIKYNWLTRCRAYDYAIGQNLFKSAQNLINSLFVIPGAAGAFKTEIFKKYLKFDHDTLTEDLDFTYKLHKNGFKIKYDRQAIAYTQDPPNLKSYINQMRRWYAGGWQNLAKHLDIIKQPSKAFQLSLMYIEGLVFSLLLFLVPLINIRMALFFIGFYFIAILIFAVYAAIKEKRISLLLIVIPYIFLIYINAWIFLEQFFKVVIFKKKNLIWFQPKRLGPV